MDDKGYFVLCWDGDNHEWCGVGLGNDTLEEAQREFRFQLSYPGTTKKNLKIVKEIPYDE